MTKETSKRKASSGFAKSLGRRINALSAVQRAASGKRKLLKARIMSLTAKVSLLESEVHSIFVYLGIEDNAENSVERKSIQQKLLTTATRLGEEE